MDAVEFLNQYSRMVASGVQPFAMPAKLPYEGIVKSVEQWAKEHPIKTRQTQFLKHFPNAQMNSGVIAICPKSIDAKKYGHKWCMERACVSCKREFWLEKVEENDEDEM